MTDQDITRRCLSAIEDAGPFPHIRIAAMSGWVHLSGFVTSAADRWRVEAAVGEVPGLAGVSAQVRVRP